MTHDKDTTVDASYAEKKTVKASAKLRHKNANSRPRKRILKDEVPEVKQCSSKVSRSKSPSMVQYNSKPSTLHLSKNASDRGIISQVHEEVSGQKSGNVNGSVTASLSSNAVKSPCKLPSNKQANSESHSIGVQSNISGPQPDLKHSNMVDTQSNPFQCKVPDSQLNITSFQPDFTDPPGYNCTSFQSHSAEPKYSFQSDVTDPEYNVISCQSGVADPRYNVISYQSNVADPGYNVISYQSDAANNLSSFESDVPSKWSCRNGHNTITDSQSNQANFGSNYTQYTFENFPFCMEKRNEGFIRRNKELSIINTREHNQAFVSSNISRNAANKSAIYYPQPSTPSSFGPRCCDAFLLPRHQMRKHFGCRGPSETLVNKTEERDKVDAPVCFPVISSEEIEEILSDYCSDFRPSFQTEETKPSYLFEEYEYQASFTTIPDIAAYQNMAFTLEKDTVETTSPFSLPFSVTPLTRSVSPAFSHEDGQCFGQFDAPGNAPPGEYFHLPTYLFGHSIRPTFMMEHEDTMEEETTLADGMGPIYRTPPMCRTTPAYSLPHLSPTEDPYSLQPESSTYPANLFSYEQQIQPAHLRQATVLTIPTYSATPYASPQLDLHVNTKDSSSQGKEANEKSEWFYGNNLTELTTVINFPPTTKESLQASGENKNSSCRTSPTPHVQVREVDTSESVPSIDYRDSQFSELSDLVKFPLTREERRRKILSAFGFEESSSESSKVAKETAEETRESEGKNVPNNKVSFPLNDEITTSQLTDTREMADLQLPQTHQATIPAVQHNTVMATLKSSLPSAQLPSRNNCLREDGDREINLRCDEVMNEMDVDRLDTSWKKKDDMTIDMAITTRNVKIKFVDETTIFLFVEALP